MDGFTTKEIAIIGMRIKGIVESPMTLDEIGKIFGVTRERVRQIEAKGRERFRQAIRIAKEEQQNNE